MSYVRFGNKGSDVYIYQDVDFGLRCQLCRLQSGVSFETRSRLEMLTHMKAHRDAGHCVPDFAIKILAEELADCGDDAPGNIHLVNAS
jgi:hypothetical protein